MAKMRKISAAQIRFAEFSIDGSRLDGDEGFLVGGPDDASVYLAEFVWIDGQKPTESKIAEASAAWRAGDRPIAVRDAAGRSCVLSRRALSGGGFCMISSDVLATPSDDGIARFIVENNPLPIWISDLETGDVLVHNKPARRLFEVDDNAPGAGNVSDYFVDDVDNRRVFADLRVHGGFDSFILRARSATGREFWVNASARVAQHNGRGILVSAIQDVTPLKQHANEVSKSRDLLADAIRALPDGFALFDDDGGLLLCNDRYRDANPEIAESIVAGVHWETLLREIAHRKIPRDAAGREGAWVTEMLAASAGLKTVEMEFADGTVRVLATHATSLGGFIISETDITARREAEEAVAQQREMLHQSEKLSAMGELLAGVAHELNNPLSVVVGHALMLEEEVESPTLKSRTGKISAAADRCARIVRTFLAMARQKPATLEHVSIEGVIDTALDVAAYGFRSTGAQIIRHQTADLPLVSADADQLAQVFANLVVNAEHVLRDKGADGVLTITTRLSDGGAVDIFFDDNGPGVPQTIRTRIFEPFFTTKTIGEGTGIGLAFCHRIIETHGGEIAIGEAPGGGARFHIRLDAAAESAQPSEDETIAPASRRGRILVIDDEDDVRELIADILSRDGYAVEQVDSAEAGLGVLPGEFDLILSDINMPGLGGRAFLDRVRDRWPELEDRIGFVTGDTLSPGAEAFLTGAGRPYLEKPVAPDELRRLAAQMMHAAEEVPANDQ